MNVALILSSGIGQRLGSTIPKQYLKICGKMVVSYVIEAALKAQKLDKIIVVAHHPFIEDLQQEYPNLIYVEGGDTRNKSLRNGVDFIKENYQCESVIVLDAVRPFVTGELIDKYLDIIKSGYDICVTTSKITDSLNCLDMKTCDRDRYFLTASPMSFEFSKLEKNLDRDSKIVEVLQMYPSNTKVYYYYDFKENYKLTYLEDLDFLECMMELKLKNGRKH